MALTRTTAFGMTVTDTEIVLTSYTGLQVSHQIIIDGEVMRVLSLPPTTPGVNAQIGVLRGIRGSAVSAHPPGSVATYGPPADFGPAKSQKRDIVSISANGVIPNPTPGTDKVVFINGTVALATLGLSNPAKDNDGDMLIVVANGKAAHILTYPAAPGSAIGLGGGAAATDVITFSGVAQTSVAFIAANELWILLGPASGAGAVAAGTVIT